MISVAEIRKLALSLKDTEEKDHFDRPSFRIKKGKIFSTIHVKDNRAMLKLSLTDQSVFCTYNPGVFYPVPNAWGRQGCTFVDIKKVRKDLFKDALTQAYQLGISDKGIAGKRH